MITPDTLISIRGATCTVRRARELGLLRPDEIAALDRPTELDAARAPVLVARKKKTPKPRAPVCGMCRGDLGAVTYASPRGECCRDCFDIIRMETGA